MQCLTVAFKVPSSMNNGWMSYNVLVEKPPSLSSKEINSTKQLDYYIVPTLVDETPQTLVIYVGSNNITRTNYKTVNVQNLAQGIIDSGLKCKLYGVRRITMSSIFTRSSAQLHQVIGEVNDLLKSLCVANGFHYISMR